MKFLQALAVMLLLATVAQAQTPACGQALAVWVGIAAGTPSESAIIPAGATYMLGSSSNCVVVTTPITVNISSVSMLFVLRITSDQTVTVSSSTYGPTTVMVPKTYVWASTGKYNFADVVNYNGVFYSSGVNNNSTVPGGPSWAIQSTICSLVSPC